MGYIIPFTHYDYIQYTNRSVEADQRTNRPVPGIHNIQPVNFNHYIKEQIDETEAEPKIEKKKEAVRDYSFMFDSSKKTVAQEIIYRTTAEMTGKGGNFNTVV
ncbi:hypothetical protein D0469_10205 [Peribacillus saganii]|uniref:Uncharacterized protein n=1 Tax=Peribacillus saganii TaxID=2303992 RepID=A0A372LPE4_9BACI|nr:hypothetical protein [Peribacillus saganii]RFU69220.1 hypothetical protein D0469_10205 [Peribacillus saganii]